MTDEEIEKYHPFKKVHCIKDDRFKLSLPPERMGVETRMKMESGFRAAKYALKHGTEDPEYCKKWMAFYKDHLNKDDAIIKAQADPSAID